MFFPYEVPTPKLEYCLKVLNTKNHLKTERIEDLTKNIQENKDKQRRDNARIRTTGVTFAPLLIGKIQFGKLKRIHIPLLRKELELRNVLMEEKEGI